MSSTSNKHDNVGLVILVLSHKLHSSTPFILVMMPIVRAALDLNKAVVYDFNMNNTSIKFGPVHEISNNVVCATSKCSDQPAHTRSLIRAFASRLNIP